MHHITETWTIDANEGGEDRDEGTIKCTRRCVTIAVVAAVAGNSDTVRDIGIVGVGVYRRMIIVHYDSLMHKLKQVLLHHFILQRRQQQQIGDAAEHSNFIIDEGHIVDVLLMLMVRISMQQRLEKLE